MTKRVGRGGRSRPLGAFGRREAREGVVGLRGRSPAARGRLLRRRLLSVDQGRFSPRLGRFVPPGTRVPNAVRTLEGGGIHSGAPPALPAEPSTIEEPLTPLPSMGGLFGGRGPLRIRRPHSHLGRWGVQALTT